ncbi:hypothetical protein BDW02DRAFT_511811, partial [Decorospora gaudefroyi]
EAYKVDSFIATSILLVVTKNSLVLVLNAVVYNRLRQITYSLGKTIRFYTLFF